MIWEWKIDDHTVLVDLNTFSGRERVCLDGEELRNKLSWKFKNEVPVPLSNGDEAVVTIGIKTLVPYAELRIGERVIPPTVGRQIEQANVPRWGWPFILACAVIPFLTMGGAVPSAIGMGCAAANWKIASSERSPAMRVGMMSGVTLFAWVLVIALVLAVGAAQG